MYRYVNMQLSGRVLDGSAKTSQRLGAGKITLGRNTRRAGPFTRSPLGGRWSDSWTKQKTGRSI
jgi:hypothetical protein